MIRASRGQHGLAERARRRTQLSVGDDQHHAPAAARRLRAEPLRARNAGRACAGPGAEEEGRQEGRAEDQRGWCSHRTRRLLREPAPENTHDPAHPDSAGSRTKTRAHRLRASEEVAVTEIPSGPDAFERELTTDLKDTTPDRAARAGRSTPASCSAWPSGVAGRPRRQRRSGAATIPAWPGSSATSPSRSGTLFLRGAADDRGAARSPRRWSSAWPASATSAARPRGPASRSPTASSSPRSRW